MLSFASELGAARDKGGCGLIIAKLSTRHGYASVARRRLGQHIIAPRQSNGAHPIFHRRGPVVAEEYQFET
jgi:hypothetical protein